MQGETAVATGGVPGASPRVRGLRGAIGARVFYGWINVAAAACMVSVGVGVVQAFAVFVAPLEQAFGWSRSAISGAYSLGFAVFGASSVLMGYLADRWGTRRVAMVGGSLYAVGLALTAWANSLWGLYVTFALIGGIGVGSLHSPLAYLAAKWFDRRKGLAMGMVLSGTGIGVMLASPFARALMAWGSWRTAFLGLGIVALLVVLGMGSLLCDTPEEMGQHVDGTPRPAGKAHGAAFGWTTATARRTHSFWVLLGTFFFCCACHSGPSLHLAAHAAGWGLSGAAAAGVLSTFGGFSIAGRIGLGLVADRIGGKRSLLISLPLQASAALWLAFTNSPWAFYASAATLGIAFGGVYAQFPAITREYFGARNVGAVYGAQMFLSSLGMAIGGYGVGALFDVTGSYRDPFLAAAFSGLISVALALGLARPKLPLPQAGAAAGGDSPLLRASA